MEVVAPSVLAPGDWYDAMYSGKRHSGVMIIGSTPTEASTSRTCRDRRSIPDGQENHGKRGRRRVVRRNFERRH